MKFLIRIEYIIYITIKEIIEQFFGMGFFQQETLKSRRYESKGLRMSFVHSEFW